MASIKNTFKKTTLLTKIRTCLKWAYRPFEQLFKPVHIPFRKSKENKVHWKQMNNVMKHLYYRKELVINDFENMSFFNFKSAQDKKGLSGMVYEPNKDSGKWVIVNHWYAGTKWWALYHALPFVKMGYNIMAFDYRGHGKSEWDTCTMGVKESRDLLGAMAWLKKNRDYKDLALMGISMGAFVVNYVSIKYAKQMEKYNVKFGVADSPFGAFDTLFMRERNIYLKFLPKLVTKKVVNWLIKREDKFEKKYKANLSSADTFKMLAKGNKPAFPIFFNHSKNDLLTPFTDTYQLVIDRSKLIDGDELNVYNYVMHTQSLRVHFKTYVDRITKYIAKQDNNNEAYEKLVKEWRLDKVDNWKDRKDQKLK